MPIYEYRCVDCGHIEEMVVPAKEWNKAYRPCPKCGGKAKKLIGRPGMFKFKGPGFHATDYASQKAADKMAEDNPNMPSTE